MATSDRQIATSKDKSNDVKILPNPALPETKIRPAPKQISTNTSKPLAERNTLMKAVSNLYTRIPVSTRNVKEGSPTASTSTAEKQGKKQRTEKEDNNEGRPGSSGVSVVKGVDDLKVNKPLQDIPEETSSQNDNEKLVDVDGALPDTPAAVTEADENDRDNPFLLSIYVNNIHKYLRKSELKFLVKEDYLEQGDIKPYMRRVIINWLVEFQEQFQFLQDTLHLGVSLFDDYVQKSPGVNRNSLQLVGVTAMYLASKYEELIVPDADDLVAITDNSITIQQLYRTEIDILRIVDFCLGRPLSIHFLRRYSKISFAHPKHHNLAKYLIDLALTNYQFCCVRPSLIAASALYLSFMIYNGMVPPEEWNETVISYTGYRYKDMERTMKLLAYGMITAPECDLQAVVCKYASPKFARISAQSCLITDALKQFAESAE